MVKRTELASSNQEQAKRVQEEFAPVARFFAGKATQFLGDVGKEHSWFIAFLKVQKECKSLASFWPHTPPCQCSGLRELAERIAFCDTIVPFCDNYAIDIKAESFGEVSCSELTFLPDLVA